MKKKMLFDAARQVGHIACLGLNPIPQYFPKPYEKRGIAGFIPFVESVYYRMVERGLMPAAVTLNEGYYEQHNSPTARRGHRWGGYDVMADVIMITHEFFPSIPVILDAGREAKGLAAKIDARACRQWDVEAVTMGAYTGEEAISAFLHDSGLMAYLSVLTSSSREHASVQHFDVTMLDSSGMAMKDTTGPMYMLTLYNLMYAHYTQDLPWGAIVDATDLGAFNRLLKQIVQHPKSIPLLVPEADATHATAIMRVLREVGYALAYARINAPQITHLWRNDMTYTNGGAPVDGIDQVVDAFEQLTQACALVP